MKAFTRILRVWLLAALLAVPVASLVAAPHIRVAGTWQEVSEVHIKVAGTWQDVQEGWVRVAGTWQQFYSALTVLMDATRSISSSEDSASTVTVQAQFYYDSDGGIRRRVETNGSLATSDYGEYIVGHPITGSGTDFYIRVTHQTGTNQYSSGSGLGSWLQLSSDRNWLFSGSIGSGASTTGTYLAEIASDAAGATVLDNSTWTISLSNAGP